LQAVPNLRVRVARETGPATIVDHLDTFQIDIPDDMSHMDVNPATGLPMMGGIDVGGSPFGMNLHDEN
jgi:hypothetical protein